MTSSALPDGQIGPSLSANDRRVNMHLRMLFENACRITEPFFDPNRGWSTAHLTLYAQQVLREAYPELSLQDIAILFSGVQSFHITSLNKHRGGS
ncbi:hypothetical protein MTYP_03152 [Methylophilaceae bacterium]|nr:hypothetical protein MTYP_03152 [Methylophilaceae bacterium]